MSNFAGQTIIITGAGDGIGQASAQQFAEHGASVVVADIKGADETAAELRSAGGEAVGFTMDVRDASAWARMIGMVLDRFGQIDALVNNAGIALPGDNVTGISEDIWNRIIDTNAKSVWLGMRTVLPSMLENRKGKICNVASTAAHIGLTDAAAYCASKGAVLALTRQAAVQYAPENIQINSISPGTTMTAIQKNVTDAQRAAFLPLTPIGRFASSDEIAKAIVFLCSDGSSFMAGADISVDGGMVAL